MPFLTAEQMEHFEEEGYLLLRGMLDVDAVIQPIIDEYHGVLDNLARELYATGQIESTYDELPFGQRLTRIVIDSGQNPVERLMVGVVLLTTMASLRFDDALHSPPDLMSLRAGALFGVS